MKIVDKISVKELKKMAEKMFGNLVKADVDIAKRIVIVDMPMHYDGEQELLLQGSKQNDIWGINLRPEHFDSSKFVQFDSMINIRPSQGNPSRDVLDEAVRKKIIEIIYEVVHE